MQRCRRSLRSFTWSRLDDKSLKVNATQRDHLHPKLSRFSRPALSLVSRYSMFNSESDQKESRSLPFRLIFISENCTFIHTFIYIRVFSLKYYFHSVSKICAALVKGCFWCSLLLDLEHHVGNFQHDDKLQVFQFLKFSNFYWFGFAGLAYTFSTASERSSPFDRNFFGSKDHPHISQDW